MISLYIHIPFCARKCAYCDFASYAGREHDIGRYTRALKAEIARAAGEFGALALSTIFIGGGTPSILPKEAIAELLRASGSEFRIMSGAEISIEANPGTLTHNKLTA